MTRYIFLWSLAAAPVASAAVVCTDDIMAAELWSQAGTSGEDNDKGGLQSVWVRSIIFSFKLFDRFSYPLRKKHTVGLNNSDHDENNDTIEKKKVQKRFANESISVQKDVQFDRYSVKRMWWTALTMIAIWN